MKLIVLLWLILGGVAVVLANFLPSRYNGVAWIVTLVYLVTASIGLLLLI